MSWLGLSFRQQATLNAELHDPVEDVSGRVIHPVVMDEGIVRIDWC